MHQAVALRIVQPPSQIPLAHSSPGEGVSGDPYARHVSAVRREARKRAEEMVRYSFNRDSDLVDAIDAAATFHDLGKLDPDNQAALQKGRGTRLRWDHIDAGVAHLAAGRDWMAAWLVRAHHSPGLPEKEAHFNQDKGPELRGRRRESGDPRDHGEQIERTNALLQGCLDVHHAVVDHRDMVPRRPLHGLTMRLALSCLVDADHTDSAYVDTGRVPSDAFEPRWDERLEALRAYVGGLPLGETDAERARNSHRAAFFDACLNSPINETMLACEGPVGLGKTTAVAAYLVRRARDEGLRRLIVIAPYTNILTQTAAVLRRALVLPGEQPASIVVEHHHRADFDCQDARELAALWRAPIILTTAVAFFETLAGCEPSGLRKLHAVPGSGIFIDEAHAAMPARLWSQNLRWLRELAERWHCRVVFASGSLARFWEDPDVVREPVRLPELLPRNLAAVVMRAERHRVRYESLAGGLVLTIGALIERVRAAHGPRLIVLNTVQNAAVVARSMRNADMDVLHLSTALTPRDREHILKQISRRLNGSPTDWSLVSTSCVEAGVDFSFRCAFRERFAVASTLQVGGRVNRHGEYDGVGGGTVYDFALAGEGVNQHPAAAVSADVLLEFLTRDELNRGDPAQIVTRAISMELSLRGGIGTDQLVTAEDARNYPEVRAQGRVIDADTRLVVVDDSLKERLAAYEPVGYRDLLAGSVQLWAARIDKLALRPFPRRDNLFAWDDLYEPHFLGVMAGVLRTSDFLAAGGGPI